MARQKKIVDASVIVKWFSEEIGTPNAIKIKEDHVKGKILILIPELALLECLNALIYKGKNKKALDNAAKDLFDLQLHVEKLSPFLLQKAIELSLSKNLSLYDSVYAALAQIHGCALATADKKLGGLFFTEKI
jgi:predicted nucleic acid-binding protein